MGLRWVEDGFRAKLGFAVIAVADADGCLVLADKDLCVADVTGTGGTEDVHSFNACLGQCFLDRIQLGWRDDREAAGIRAFLQIV